MNTIPFIARHHPRRGVAILLVLISLMMATILTSAYLASRDNSSIIGENVASAARARWASSSALQMGVVILQTEANWRTSHTNGKLIDDLPIDGALVDIDLLDLQTNAPPTLATTSIRITTTALADGVTQTASAIASIQPDDDEIDVGLTEFAAFGKDAVKAKNTSTIARWASAPLAALGHPVYIATQSLAAGALEIDPDAAIIDGMVFAKDTASNSLVNSASALPVQRYNIKSLIPMPAGVAPNLYVGLYGADYTLASADQTFSGTTAKNSVTLNTGANLSLADGAFLVVKTDLTISGGKIIINGAAAINVKKDLDISSGSIELQPNAVLRLFVGENIELDQAYIGDLRADSTRDNSGSASYVDPNTIQVYSHNTGTSSLEWRFRDNSVTKGLYYAPNRSLRVEDNSAIYGSVIASTVEVHNNGALFYDPALDSGTGYTNPNSALFAADGTIIPEIVSLASLDSAALNTVSTLTNLRIKSRGTIVSTLGLEDVSIKVPPPANQPTPRPILVDYNMQTFGTDIAPAEQRAVSAG